MINELNGTIDIEKDKLDPFDVANLRIAGSAPVAVKKLLTTVPVRKPNKQEFIRVHGDPAYSPSGLAFIELKDEREAYLLTPDVAEALPGEYSLVTLHTAVSRQGVLFLWPVKLPGPDGRANPWHASAGDAAERAKSMWLRVHANMSLGAYDQFVAEGKLPDPEWPDLPFNELLRIAFRDRLVSGLDHPLLDVLRGRS
jgi:hypothetical protein